MKKFDVVALGELLIDFTENGVSGQGNTVYEANPGGAPCNVLAMLNKAGRKTAFIGKVGQDIFGNKLKATLDEVGIDTSNLIIDEDARTTLAFVETFPDGDRDFSFYRNPGADMMLTEDDLHEDLIRDTKIFHYGTLSMTHDAVRNATKKAIDIAKESGAILSFDPNLRPPLWKTLDDAKEQVAYGLSKCDVLKISDNEIQWFTGEEDYDAGIAKLREQYDIPLIMLSLGRDGSRAYYVLKISDNEIQWFTGEEDYDAGIAKLREQYDIPLIMLSLGRDGSRAYYKDLRVEVKPFLQESTIETTGAGDTFGGCCLHHVLKYGLDNLDEEKLTEMLTFANAAASIITTRKGALRVMPEVEEVEAFIKSRA